MGKALKISKPPVSSSKTVKNIEDRCQTWKTNWFMQVKYLDSNRKEE